MLVVLALCGSPRASDAQPRPDLVSTAERVNAYVRRLYAEGNYTRGVEVAEGALPIMEQGFGPNHPLVASDLAGLAAHHLALGHLQRAEEAARRALRIQEGALGADHVDVATTLVILAKIERERGRAPQAEPLASRALRIFEAAYGRTHHDVGSALSVLAGAIEDQGAYERAEAPYRRSLEIDEALRGPDHPDVAADLGNLAVVYLHLGSPDRARPLLERAVSITESRWGPTDARLASPLCNLASAQQDLGAYDLAEPLFLRAMRLIEAARGPNDLNLATVARNLADLYESMGLLDRAEALLRRSLAIEEVSPGADPEGLGIALNNLAGVLDARLDWEHAVPVHERAVQVMEAARGATHPDVARALGGLAAALRETGAPERAGRLYLRALEIEEAALGPNHPALCVSLNNLATHYAWLGQHARGEPLLRRALAIAEATRGPDSIDASSVRWNLASNLSAQGRAEEALPLQRSVFAAREALLRRVRLVSTEARLTTWLDEERFEEMSIYSLLLERPSDADARRLALTVALLRKGRSLDETAATAAVIRRSLSPADQQRLDELRALRSQVAAMSLRGAGSEGPERFRASLASLEERASQVEQELAERSAAMRRQQVFPEAATVVDRVAAALPRDAALVEYVVVHRYDHQAQRDANAWGAPHLVAVTLLPDGRTSAVDLGLVSAIESAARAFRSALASPRASWQSTSRALDRVAFAPVRALLGDVRHVLLSTEGALSMVPFEALDDGAGPLLERYRFAYLSSGRDLLRPSSSVTRNAEALIIADPTFAPLEGRPPRCASGRPPRALRPARRGTRGITLEEVPPLPCTRLEAESIRALLPNARVLLGDAATEEALLGVRSPGVLHVATHGVFLDDLDEARPSTRGFRLTSDSAPPPAPSTDPLLRSALVLAGAATTRSADASAASSDGLATALEVAGMNLWGTQLVVLSACDTGRGETRRSHGVYGLRRALFVAGAESVVTSLWQVDDEVTRELMTRFYQGLVRGTGRAESLREAASAVRAGHEHPYYWAPFIAIGDESPLRAR